MLESLRQAFREAVDNFRTELNRDAVPEAADRLFRAMAREVTEARARLEELRKEVSRVEKEARAEEEAARTCLRREELARGIGDTETEEVARDFAVRHLRRQKLLEEKAEVLGKELEDREREVEEMMVQLKEARTQREELIASAGRSGARDRIREADDLFAEMDRMAERIGDTEARAAATEELARDLVDEEALWDEPAPSRGSAPSEAELEARLRELKRRMASE